MHINLIDLGLFARFINFLNRLFFKGPREVVRKIEILCNSLKEPSITEDDAKSIFSSLLVSTEELEIKNSFTKLRNQMIEQIMATYKDLDLNPLLFTLINNQKKLLQIKTLKLGVLLEFFIKKDLKKILDEIASDSILKNRQEQASYQLKKLKNDFLTKNAKNDSELTKDLINGFDGDSENLDIIEASYRQIIVLTRNYFDSIQKQINTLSTDFGSEIFKKLKHSVLTDLDDNVYRIMFQSKFNKTVGFLDDERVVDLGKLYNYLETIGLIRQKNSKNLEQFKIFFLESKSTNKQKMII